MGTTYAFLVGGTAQEQHFLQNHNHVLLESSSFIVGQSHAILLKPISHLQKGTKSDGNKLNLGHDFQPLQSGPTVSTIPLLSTIPLTRHSSQEQAHKHSGCVGCITFRA
jgi:hypothetical protein